MGKRRKVGEIVVNNIPISLGTCGLKLATVEIRRIVYKEYRPGQKPFVMTLPARSARIRVQDINLNDILEALKDLGSMSPKAGMPFPLPGILMNKWGKALGSGEPGGTP